MKVYRENKAFERVGKLGDLKEAGVMNFMSHEKNLVRHEWSGGLGVRGNLEWSMVREEGRGEPDEA